MSLARRTCVTMTVRGLLDAAACVVVGASLIGFAAPRAAWADLAAHFRVQYLSAACALAAALLVTRRRRAAALLCVVALVNLLPVAPRLWGRAPGPHAGVPLRVMLANVHTANEAYDRVRDAVQAAAPDVLVLQEIDTRWLIALAPLDAVFPYRHVVPRGDNFGIGLWSRYPLDDVRTAWLGDVGVPSINATVRVPGARPCALLATHPVPPRSIRLTQARDQQLDDVAETVNAAQRRGEVILVGDLNATPWSRGYRRLVRATGLRDAARGFGVQTTWPVGMPWMRIPIDHVLHSAGVQTTWHAVGPDVGSDHLPVVADLVLPRDAEGT